MEKKITSDPMNYHKLSEPFEGTDKADEALTGFYKEVSELRKKHHIRDLAIVIYGSIKYEDGKVGEFMQHTGFGNTLNQLPMFAYAYGQEKAESDERINKLISSRK